MDTETQTLPATYHQEPDASYIFPPKAMEKLIENGHRIIETGEHDFQPVVRLFTPWRKTEWLIVSVHPEKTDLAYGLYNDESETPELQVFSVSTLESTRGPLHMSIERDLNFVPDRSIYAYLDAAFAAHASRV